MLFSVIIVNFNTKGVTRECLLSLFAHVKAESFEVILVDNDSKDGSVAYLEKEFGGKIKIIANNKNVGFGAANNLGAKAARGEYLFFLNSDTLLKSDILPELKNILAGSGVGIVAPKLITANGKEQADSFGRHPTLLRSVLNKLRLGGEVDLSASLYEVDWVSGAALAISKKLFDRIGGFDENFFMYFEDIDLCKRVADSGLKILVDRNARVTHLVGGSEIGKRNRKALYYKSQDLFFLKYHGHPRAIVMRILRLPIKLLRIIS